MSLSVIAGAGIKMHWLVVGAGFTGATAARRLAEDFDCNVLLIDRRLHVGGNAYDLRDDSGALVHRYGPHIFHTNSLRVVRFLSRFTSWRSYEHRVQALVDGQLIPLPFGFKAIDALFSSRTAERIKSALTTQYGLGARIPVLKLRDSQDSELRELAEFVLEKVFRGYTRKQWGCEPEVLDPAVTARVPILASADERYFPDKFQAMPNAGYSALFQQLLDHPRITVKLGVAYEELPRSETLLPTVFTGPLDAYFQFKFGILPYRSIHFIRRTVSCARVQPCAVLNFPSESDFAFTRTTEMSWITGDLSSQSILIDEYPCAHEPERNEALYPIPAPSTQETASKYRRKADALSGRIWFAGRLGDYMYYNMDQACARALSLIDKKIAPFLKRH